MDNVRANRYDHIFAMKSVKLFRAMKKSLLFSTIVISFLLSCKQPHTENTNYVSPFNRDSLAGHIIVLASDSFQGRKPFSRGESLTLDYLVNQFSSMGLEPGNGSSYLQEVPMVKITAHPDSLMNIESAKGNFTLSRSTDFVLNTENTDSLIELNRDDLIFAGYGVVAPEYNWNDYAGIDVKGKVVMVMVNDPGFGTGDTTMFKGNMMTYYGRWTYKYEEAARQGAKACLIIHNDKAASYPFSVVQNSWGSSNLFLDKRGTGEHPLALRGWVSANAAKKILAAAGKDTTLLVLANHPGFKAISLGEKISIRVRVKSEYKTSQNVFAKISGTKRPNEYILYTAHWDHLGVGRKDARGDSIYNGALDNASGTAALLEMARAFKNLDIKPERTILFLSVTGEEQGLLGSEYYGQHPVYPLSNTVADLNMDGVNPNEKTNDIVITGFGQNELENYVADVAKIQGRYLAPEAHPEAGSYYRSDHFSLAKVGVPALSVSGGIDVVGKGKDYGRKQKDEYIANQYHSPSDEYNPKWSFEGGIQDMDLLFMIGKRLAFETSWPKWKPGSEFKNIRERN